MKWTFLTLAVLCFSITTISLLAQAAPTTAPATMPSASGKPINTHCPINRDEEVDPAITTVYKGKTIAFCCKSCLPQFKKDPEKYMKDLK